MQMILREVVVVVGGGGIMEQANIKPLTTPTSEGPELQKGLASLAANTLQAGTVGPITRSLSQGYFTSYKKAYVGSAFL